MGGCPHMNTPSKNNGRHATDIGNHSDIIKHLRKTFRAVTIILGLQSSSEVSFIFVNIIVNAGFLK